MAAQHPGVIPWGTNRSLRSGRCAPFVSILFAAALVIPALAASPPVVPLERDFTIRAWSKEHGLPDDRVLSLLQDRQGFLWIGTRKGVSRFDGTRFVTWSRSTHGVFTSEECRALAEGRDGTIWIGTTDGVIQLGASLVRHETGTGNEVWSLLETDPGELLVATSAGLLIRHPGGAWHRTPDVESLSTGGVRILAASPDGDLWTGTAVQLFRRARSGDPWTPDLRGPETIEAQSVSHVTVTRRGDVYAIMGNWKRQSGRLLRRDGGEWKPVLNLTQTRPAFLVADAAGNLWFPTTGPGIGCWRQDCWTEYALPPRLAGDTLQCLAEDAEGNLWAGTEQNGLLRIQRRRVRNLTPADGLPAAETRALLETADGALWVGTDGGAVRLAGSDRRTFTPDSGLGPGKVRAFAEDSSGRVWIGVNPGLFVWDGRTLERVEFPGAEFRSKIRALHAGRDGSMWVGTAQGLYRLHGGDSKAWLPRDGLPHESVCALLEDGAGRLWVGTDGGGLARFDGVTFEKFNGTRGLSSLRVWALHEDDEGALWIGTDRGLNVLRGDRIFAITTTHGLPDNLVNGIAGDRHGWLWIGHDRGVFRVNRRELIEVAGGFRARVRCVTYAGDDGMANPETNGQISSPSTIRLRDGRIAVATMGGVALFDPTALPDLTNGPALQIEELRALGRTVFATRPGSAGYPFGAGANEPVLIPPDVRGWLDLHYTALAFRASDQVRFSHRLLGYSSNWADAGSLRQASYANLAPGDYTFEVTAANHHGYASARPARLRFRVVPRWYERWVVRAGGAALLGGALVAAIRWRLPAMRRWTRLEQEAALARERARLARDLHDGLGASLTEITLLSGLGEHQALTREALVERFDRLSQRTHDALHSLRQLIWTTHPKADSLEMLVSRICASAELSLETAGIRCRLDFPTELPCLALGSEFRRGLLLAANEAVHNAVRHARAAQVTLTLRFESPLIVLEVADDGRGFDVAAARSRPADGDSGLGLASMRERAAGLGGSCSVHSEPGSGTRVTFRIPLPARP